MLPRARWNLSFSTVTDNAHLHAEITPRLFCTKVFFNLDQPEGSWQSRSKVRHGNSTRKAPIFFTPLTSCQALVKLGLHLIINYKHVFFFPRVVDLWTAWNANLGVILVCYAVLLCIIDYDALWVAQSKSFCSHWRPSALVRLQGCGQRAFMAGHQKGRN